MPSGGLYCCVYGCGNNTNRHKEKNFFRLPTDPKRLALWLSLIKREDLLEKSKSRKLCQRVCSDHFSQENITYIKTLNKDADPCSHLPIFDWQEEPEESTSSSSPRKRKLITDLGLKVSAPETSEGPQPLDRCRFCAEYSKDCVDVTSQDRPYLTRNKTTLTLNDLTVELDFNNDALPKAVCGICDRKLQAMYDFFKQVEDAQETLIKVNVKEEIEAVIVNTEYESPTPKDEDDVDEIDSKDGIIDSITVTKTVVVKPYCNRRKSVKIAPKTQKKPKTESKDIKTEKCELLIDVKEETLETVDSYEGDIAENPKNDTETDVKPSVSGSGLATSALVNEMSDSETFS